jgi:hypothetical protein
MRMGRVMGLAAFAMLAAGMLAACEEEGPAEKAGKAMDNAVEKTGEAMRDAGREIERKAD